MRLYKAISCKCEYGDKLGDSVCNIHHYGWPVGWPVDDPS